MTKHEQVIQYIKAMPIGEKLSVRGIARRLEISDGTAYRAIKDAEDKGLVSTIERVGTIRIEQVSPVSGEMLTYEELVEIIDGKVLSGHAGLEKRLDNFIIGAMAVESIKKYFDQRTLMIVGNREEVQMMALENNVAVLITGDFTPSKKVVALAKLKELPLLSTTYDTFSVATIINRSLSDQMIKRKIIRVEDIYTPIEEAYTLETSDTVHDFQQLAMQTGISRFPVQQKGRLMGVIAAKDIIGRNPSMLLERVMTRNVITTAPHMSVISVSHKMTWEDIEMVPVVADNLELLGIVTQQDIMVAYQRPSQQNQLTNTFEEDIIIHMEKYPASYHAHPYDYQLKVQAHMLNRTGSLSYGALAELITFAAEEKVRSVSEHNLLIQSMDLHYFVVVQLDNRLQFQVDIFHQTRRQTLVEVNVYHENTIIAKAMISCQMLDKIYR